MEATSPFLRVGRRGFTLIELLVVLVIVGVLVAIALPSFISQIRKSRRADAITEIYRVSQTQERWRASNTTYNDIAAYNMPSGYYSISITNTSAVRYTITATAINGMAGDTNCRTLIMDMNSGVLAYTSTNAGGQPQAAQSAANLRCWNRG